MRSFRIAVLALAALAVIRADELPRTAPPLEVKTYDGQSLALAQLKGKVVAVMFFLTTCPHCQHTTQLLNPIYDQWKSRGLEILGLAINPSAAGALKEFADRYNAKFPLGLSMSSECNRFANASVMRRFQVPYLFLVDRNGMIREEHPGADRDFWINQELNLKNSIDRLLSEPAGGKKPNT